MDGKDKKSTYNGITEFERNQENPFLKQAIEQVQKNLVKRFKTTGTTDKKAILQAFDPDSGEVLGHTQFIKQIEVDEDQFAKLYLTQFPAFFDLKNVAIRVFGYILTVLIPNKDFFYFNREECMKYTNYKSDASVFKGLAQLIQCGIIARSKTDYMYFINPIIFFNGDRITFAKTFVKKQKSKPIAGPELPFAEYVG